LAECQDSKPFCEIHVNFASKYFSTPLDIPMMVYDTLLESKGLGLFSPLFEEKGVARILQDPAGLH
jgi:hypothetical protein